MEAYLTIALPLIKRWEGFVDHPYQDVTGTWTIGYGFTQGVTRNTPKITQTEADAQLVAMLTKLNQRLNTEVFVELSNHQRAALLSLIWNIGMGTFARSTLLHRLSNGAYGDAAAQFLVFTYSKGIQEPGLHKRRQAEKACFETKD